MKPIYLETIHESESSMWKFLILEKNTWNNYFQNQSISQADLCKNCLYFFLTIKTNNTVFTDENL